MSGNGRIYRRYAYRPNRWCLFVQIAIRNQVVFANKIYFPASWGGIAKSKALPKLQHLVEDFGSEDGNRKKMRIKAYLEKELNGNDPDRKAPKYALRENYTYYQGILSTNEPSRAFKILKKNSKETL